MGRTKIELEFYDKKYTIEYDRMSVKKVVSFKGEDDIDNVVNLVKCGLYKNHSKDLPNDNDILGWVLALGEDVIDFAQALQEMVQDVLDTFKEDRKNLKWAKVQA